MIALRSARDGGAMRAMRYQRGELPVGCLVGFVVIVLVVIFAMNMIPAQLKIGEFEKRINELADRANRRDYTVDVIRSRIMDKARDLDLMIEEKDLIIDRNDRRIIIKIKFDQEIRFPGRVWVRHHDYRLERPII
jgi:hypothetical protein